MDNLELKGFDELSSVELEATNGGAMGNAYTKMYEMWNNVCRSFVEGFNDGSGANCK